VQDDSNRLEQVCEITDRRGRQQRHSPLSYAAMRRNGAALQALLDAGANIRDLDSALFGPCENHNLEELEFLLPFGIDPNHAYNDGWDCDVLYGMLQTYTRSAPEHLHACVNILIEAGARFTDGPVMDIHRGQLDRLEERLRQNPDLVHERFVLDYGDHLTLRGVTLLHVAAEYCEIECIDLLLRYGADLNAPAAIGANGVGGQTPLFHTIGSNQGSGFETFEHLLAKNPELTMRARIQADAADSGKVMDGVHKGKDHFFEKVVELTPLGYAEFYENEPDWREASREVARLRDLGAVV
jgi:ankyrin repeat protein